MRKIVRTIKNEKRGKLYCYMVEREDKNMINQALQADKILGEQLLAIRSGIPLLIEMGLYTVDEAVEIVKHIEAVMKIISERDAEKTGNRVADLSIRRIAKMVGGEVVEETTRRSAYKSALSPSAPRTEGLSMIVRSSVISRIPLSEHPA